MGVVQYAVNFASSFEGYADTLGNYRGFRTADAAAVLASDGDPAQKCLEWFRSASGPGNFIYGGAVRLDTTWQGIGVPVGARVLSLKLTAIHLKLAQQANITSYDVQVGLYNATLVYQNVYAVTNPVSLGSGWQTLSGTDALITTHPAWTEYVGFEICSSWASGAGSPRTMDLFVDTLLFDVTHDGTGSGGTPGGGGDGGGSFGSGAAPATAGCPDNSSAAPFGVR